MEESENKFLLKTALRYIFHLSAFTVFVFLSPRLYFDFQNVAINALSAIKYSGNIKTSPEWLMLIFTVTLIFYREDYLLIKKAKLNGYYILPLLGSDVICLIIATLVMIIYNNIIHPKTEDVNSLNNPLIATGLIMIKNWVIEFILKKRSIVTIKFAA